MTVPLSSQAPSFIRPALLAGMVIPAHPLALDRQRQFDALRQRALTRYYLDSGAGGLAVGVHTTQFEIRDPRYNLFEPVLALAAETVDEWEQRHKRRIVRIAGLCGATAQAVGEAQTARELGYHAGLLSLAAFKGAREADILLHCRRVAEEMPLFGFYLQPAVGGIPLSYPFWRSFLEIPNVLAVKVAPFNRYATLEVARALAESGRVGEVALYTGNDDHILFDLLAAFVFQVNGNEVRVGFQGGLLGHWACWTRQAVEHLARCQQARQAGVISGELLALANQVTDCNAAFFDAAHAYAGVLPGVNEVLRRQGLLESNLCLNEHEQLSPGQIEEIERVYQAYPHLNDDAFVRENLDRWLK